MALKERCNVLLLELLQNTGVDNNHLQKTFNLSRRQVDYTIEKINEGAIENDLPVIRKSKGKFYKVDESLYQLLDNATTIKNNEFFISDELLRSHIMILMMAIREEDYSLIFFADEFSISKNTVLKDLKMTQKLVNKFNVKTHYSRLEGYVLKGEEWDIRTAMIESLSYVIKNSYNSNAIFSYFLNLSIKNIENLIDKLHQVEEKLKLTFIDVHSKVLPYIFESIFQRVANHHMLEKVFFIDYEDLSDTREFEAVNLLLPQECELSKEEKIYLSLHLLSSNVHLVEKSSTIELPNLKKSLLDLLNDFENKSCTQIVEKKLLLERLFVHFKPAYYRIKYKLTTDYRVLSKLDKDFQTIHFLLKDSLYILEDYIGEKIPETEAMFLTILIGGHLLDNDDRAIISKKKAVVICPNGLSISQLMERKLKKLFPELYFYPAMSIREYKKSDLEFDLIFSSTPIITDTKLFVVDQIITGIESINLRNQVRSYLYLLNSQNINMVQLLEVIEESCVVNNREKLEKGLNNFFENQLETSDQPILGIEKESGLSDLLKQKYIIVVDSVESWHHALELSSKPLLKDQIITDDYLVKMKSDFEELPDYIVLRNQIAIPHANPESGVNKLGMSLLVIKEGLTRKSGKKIHFVVTIASPSHSAHFNALLELLELSGNKELLAEMKTMSNKSIHDTIQNYIFLENN